MRMPGFCTKCHRPRTVAVSGSSLALAGAHGVVQGICQECESKAEIARHGQLRCRECGYERAWFRGWSFTGGQCSRQVTGLGERRHAWEQIRP
jgi:protein-arginine kinase activator protein McsA